MIKLHTYLSTIAFLLSSYLSFSQNYYLPDTNLVKALKTTRPQVLKGDSLIISEAKKITGYLNLTNSNINNAEGVQFFSNISQLDLSINNLTTIPDLSDFTGLTKVYFLQNQLKSLPNLPKTVEVIYAFENQIEDISNLTNLSNLNLLHVSYNKLKEIPDLQNFPNLEKLHVNSNQLKELKGLNFLPKLTDLFAWNNQISSLDDLNDNTTLIQFVVYQNNLSSLPNLANKPNLSRVYVYENFLSFSNIYPLKSNPKFDSIFQYSNMKEFTEDVVVNSYNNSTFEIFSKLDTQLTDIQYEIYVNDTSFLESNFTGNFKLDGTNFSDKDSFHIKIKSNYIPNMTLTESKWTLNKISCSSFMPEYITILENNCLSGANIKFLPNNYNSLFNYTLESKDKVYQLNDSLSLENIPQGSYQLKISSEQLCNISKSFLIPNSNNCQAIFSPNNDGIKDDFFFEKGGFIKIINTKGEEVLSLEGPATWNGSDKNGNIVPIGYYTVIFEDNEIFHLTVMK